MGIIQAEGGEVVGVVVGLDRMERVGGGDDDDGEGEGGKRSAVQELRRTLGVPVLAVLTLDDLIGFAGGEEKRGVDLERLRAYRERWIARDE